MRPLRAARYDAARSIAAGVAIALIAAGCGDPAAVTGRSLFASAGCGGCHTLAAAGAHGQVGPNLDDIAPSFKTVLRQVTDGGNGMPSFRTKLGTHAIRTLANYVSRVTQSSHHIPQFVSTRTTVAQCASQDLLCLRQAFGNLAFLDGPRLALARLQADTDTHPNLGTFCHQIAHEIGHAAYAKYDRNAARALSQGAMTCGSGYYHGVVEMAFNGLPRSQVANLARTLCTTLAQTDGSFVLYQCVHGLGHGLMIYSADDLPYALHICDGLQTYFDQQSCGGGAFMQNFTTGPAAMVATRWTKANDLLYPCDTVAPRDKPYCYLQITDRILPAVGYDWTKAAAWCRHSQPGWIADCFQSLGRDASGFETHQPARILRDCTAAGRYASDCIYGAVRDIADNDANAHHASAFCSAAPTPSRSRCFQGLGSILAALHTKRVDRATACNDATPVRYRQACYGGAGLPPTTNASHPPRTTHESHMR